MAHTTGFAEEREGSDQGRTVWAGSRPHYVGRVKAALCGQGLLLVEGTSLWYKFPLSASLSGRHFS